MLAENLQKVQENIAAALAKRTEKKVTGDHVTLVAVTKNHPAQVILDIEALQIGNVGENRAGSERKAGADRTSGPMASDRSFTDE